ncbi:hypothetical protein [Cronobacter dublinensis]|uniref:hypothetical protein n=1 Tax=Cronobacter dublinensis TaxID=413497 RepID=UPI0024AEB3EF|nr:hypothetical protein [Cronobacter dublinensis]MDI7502452.1 hypothetical protein [Cronobacter dublinensis]
MKTMTRNQSTLTISPSPSPSPSPSKVPKDLTTSPLHHPGDNKMCKEIILSFLFGIPYAAALNAAILNKNDLKLSLAYVGIALAVIWIGYDLSKLNKKTKYHILFTIATKAIPALLALFAVIYG